MFSTSLHVKFHPPPSLHHQHSILDLELQQDRLKLTEGLAEHAEPYTLINNRSICWNALRSQISIRAAVGNPAYLLTVSVSCETVALPTLWIHRV